jgi:hypothetical protein
MAESKNMFQVQSIDATEKVVVRQRLAVVR